MRMNYKIKAEPFLDHIDSSKTMRLIEHEHVRSFISFEEREKKNTERTQTEMK